MTLADQRAESTSPSITAVVDRLRTTYRAGRTRPAAWRRAQLDALERMVHEREADFGAALVRDLGRTETEAWLADLAPVDAEIRYAQRYLERWMRPTRARLPLALRPGQAWTQPEPLGVVGIIGPWNYPVNMMLAPLVGVLAAGNCAVLKPSEFTPSVSAALARIVPQYLDPDAIAVVEGGAAETQELIGQGLDHICFTGSPAVGKLIMAAAAEHLTPVTLELGGKSPVIVTGSADVRVAARRVALGKVLNSGQTCIAPDYVLVDEAVRDRFVNEFAKAVDSFRKPAQLPLVHERRAERIAELIRGAGGRIVRGGSVDGPGHRAALTVVVDPEPASELMQEEIFGPVMPVVTIRSLDDAIAHVLAGPKPLAVYLFSSDRGEQHRVVTEISDGATVINQVVMHVLAPQLPFGGVGNSGMGAYHGKWGFETFSHRKTVLRKPSRPDPTIVYPPYTGWKRRLLRTLL